MSDKDLLTKLFVRRCTISQVSYFEHQRNSIRKMGINRKTKFQTYNACMAEGKFEVNGQH